MSSGLIVLIGIGYLTGNSILAVVLFIAIALALYLFRKWSVKHFGGVTGDLSGGFIEGMEAVLWLVVCVLL